MHARASWLSCPRSCGSRASAPTRRTPPMFGLPRTGSSTCSGRRAARPGSSSAPGVRSSTRSFARTGRGRAPLDPVLRPLRRAAARAARAVGKRSVLTAGAGRLALRAGGGGRQGPALGARCAPRSTSPAAGEPAGQRPVLLRLRRGGRRHVDRRLSSRRRPARRDACVIFDTAMLDDETPVFTIATRGTLYLHVEVRTGRA